MRYIEVLTHVRTERAIEAYEASLELSTATGKRVSCADESLALRESVLAALKQAGLSDTDVREGGGEASQNSWSSSKSILHRIILRNANMDVLISAMAATERLFASQPKPFFARVKHNFTFHPPRPVYAADASADDATREALRRARSIAELLADESGMRLGDTQFVVECDSRHSRDPFKPQPFEPPCTSVDYCLSDDDMSGATTYTGLPSATADTLRRFRIRFSVDDAVPGNLSEPGRAV